MPCVVWMMCLVLGQSKDHDALVGAINHVDGAFRPKGHAAWIAHGRGIRAIAAPA